MNSDCRDCMQRKFLNQYPEGTPEEVVKRYQDAVISLTGQSGAVPTGSEVFCRVRELRKELFGEGEMDYTKIKRHFNDLMLGMEDELERRVRESDDPLRRAVQYAMMGNFIDFSALENVEEKRLMELLDRAPEIAVDEECLEHLREQTSSAGTLTYITDNCGEIVMDKILLRWLKRLNPELAVTVLLRGGPVANDATMEDAEQVGLTALGRCIGNGTATDGTVLRIVSREARESVIFADLIIAKGQANYETLYGCGHNIFYIFMCKCSLFMDRFSVPQFTGILTQEDPEILMNVYADEALLERFRFREPRSDEAAQIYEIEKICFPPNEACPEAEMYRRVERMPEQFLIAVDRNTGVIAGFLDGLASDEKEFRDEFFTDVTLHDPAAQTEFLMGLDVLPQYRGQGLARELVRLYGIRGQVRGRLKMVLTAHEEKLGMYEKMGFKDLGISGSVWGGNPWHEMEIRLDR